MWLYDSLLCDGLCNVRFARLSAVFCKRLGFVCKMGALQIFKNSIVVVVVGGGGGGVGGGDGGCVGGVDVVVVVNIMKDRSWSVELLNQNKCNLYP